MKEGFKARRHMHRLAQPQPLAGAQDAQQSPGIGQSCCVFVCIIGT